MKYSDPRGYPILEGSDVPDLVSYFPALAGAIDDDMTATLIRLKAAEDKLANSDVAPARRMLTKTSDQTMNGNGNTTAPSVITWVPDATAGDPATSSIALFGSGALQVGLAGLYLMRAAYNFQTGSWGMGIRVRGNQVVDAAYASGSGLGFVATQAQCFLSAGDTVEFLAQYGGSSTAVATGGPVSNTAIYNSRRMVASIVRLGA